MSGLVEACRDIDSGRPDHNFLSYNDSVDNHNQNISVSNAVHWFLAEQRPNQSEQRLGSSYSEPSLPTAESKGKSTWDFRPESIRSNSYVDASRKNVDLTEHTKDNESSELDGENSKSEKFDKNDKRRFLPGSQRDEAYNEERVEEMDSVAKNDVVSGDALEMREKLLPSRYVERMMGSGDVIRDCRAFNGESVITNDGVVYIIEHFSNKLYADIMKEILKRHEGVRENGTSSQSIRSCLQITDVVFFCSISGSNFDNMFCSNGASSMAKNDLAVIKYRAFDLSESENFTNFDGKSSSGCPVVQICCLCKILFDTTQSLVVHAICKHSISLSVEDKKILMQRKNISVLIHNEGQGKIFLLQFSSIKHCEDIYSESEISCSLFNHSNDTENDANKLLITQSQCENKPRVEKQFALESGKQDVVESDEDERDENRGNHDNRFTRKDSSEDLSYFQRNSFGKERMLKSETDIVGSLQRLQTNEWNLLSQIAAFVRNGNMFTEASDLRANNGIADNEMTTCDLPKSEEDIYGGPGMHATTSSQLLRNSCKMLKCPRCNWHYKYQETLEIHMREKHPEADSHCMFCIGGQPHPRLARGEVYTCGYKPYRCDVCNYSTTTKGNLSIHMQSDRHINNVQELHSIGTPSTSMTKSPPAPPSVSPDNNAAKKTKSKPSWRCDVCSYETNVARNLRIHMTSEKHAHNLLVLQQGAKHNLPSELQLQLNQIAMMSQDAVSLMSMSNPWAAAMMPFHSFEQSMFMAQPSLPPMEFPVDLTRPPKDVCPQTETMSEQNSTGDSSMLYQCTICCIFSTDSLDGLHQHEQLDRTGLGSEREGIVVVSGTYICSLCQYKSNLKANFQLHCKTDKHLQRLQLVNHIREGGAENEWRHLHNNMNHLVTVRCNACDYGTNSVYKLQIHSSDPEHSANVILFRELLARERQVAPSDLKRYSCIPCGYMTKTRQLFVRHLTTGQHRALEQQYLEMTKQETSDKPQDALFSILPCMHEEADDDICPDERDRKFKKESVTTTTAASVGPTTSSVCQIPATSTLSQRRFSPDEDMAIGSSSGSMMSSSGAMMSSSGAVMSSSGAMMSSSGSVMSSSDNVIGHSIHNLTSGPENLIKKPLTCQLCLEDFENQSKLEDHVIKVHSVRPEVLKLFLSLGEKKSFNPTTSTVETSSKRDEDGWQANEKENNACPETKRNDEISDSDLEKAEVHALQFLEKVSDSGRFIFQLDLTNLCRCTICFEKFSSLALLFGHQNELGHLELRQTKQGPGYLCWSSGCDCHFSTAIRLQDHFREVHVDSQLSRHTKDPHLYPEVCKNCGLGFKNADQLKNHLLSHSISSVKKCSMCELNFATLVEVRDHVETVHRDEDQLREELIDVIRLIVRISKSWNHEKEVLENPASEEMKVGVYRSNEEKIDREEGEEMEVEDGKELGEIQKPGVLLEDYTDVDAELRFNDPICKYKCHRCKMAFYKQSQLMSHNRKPVHRRGDPSKGEEVGKCVSSDKIDNQNEISTEKNSMFDEIPPKSLEDPDQAPTLAITGTRIISAISCNLNENYNPSSTGPDEGPRSNTYGCLAPREKGLKHVGGNSDMLERTTNQTVNKSYSKQTDDMEIGKNEIMETPQETKDQKYFGRFRSLEEHLQPTSKMQIDFGSDNCDAGSLHSQRMSNDNGARHSQRMPNHAGSMHLMSNDAVSSHSQRMSNNTGAQHSQRMMYDAGSLHSQKMSSDSGSLQRMSNEKSYVQSHEMSYDTCALQSHKMSYDNNTCSMQSQSMINDAGLLQTIHSVTNSTTSSVLSKSPISTPSAVPKLPCTRCSSNFVSSEELMLHQKMGCSTTQRPSRPRTNYYKKLLQSVGFECAMLFNESFRQPKKQERSAPEEERSEYEETANKEMNTESQVQNEKIPELNRCVCRHCAREFSSIWVLKAHKEEVHSDLVPLQLVEEFGSEFKRHYDNYHSTATNERPESPSMLEKSVPPTTYTPNMLQQTSSEQCFEMSNRDFQMEMLKQMSMMMPMDVAGMGCLPLGLPMMPSLLPMMFPFGMPPEMFGMPGLGVFDPSFFMGQQLPPLVLSPDSTAQSSSLTQQQSMCSNSAQHKRARTRITDGQLNVLRAHFDISNSPSDEQVAEMAKITRLPPKVIKHWFRNTLFKERQRSKDSPYNFNNPPTTLLAEEGEENLVTMDVESSINGDVFERAEPIVEKEEIKTVNYKHDNFMATEVVKQEMAYHEKQETVYQDKQETVYHESKSNESSCEEGISSSSASTPIPIIAPSMFSGGSLSRGSRFGPTPNFYLPPAPPSAAYSTVPFGIAPPPMTSQSHHQSGHGKRANRTHFTDHQIKVLQEHFELNAYPKDEELEMLSGLLDLSPRVIIVWFQNARQKARKTYENQPPVENPNNSDHGNGSMSGSSATGHPSGLKYQCPVCLTVFERYYELIKHQRLQCHKDGKVVRSESQTSPAVSEYSSSDECQKQRGELMARVGGGRNESTMPGIECEVGRGTGFSCMKCNLVFSSVEKMKEHEMMHGEDGAPSKSAFELLQSMALQGNASGSMCGSTQAEEDAGEKETGHDKRVRTTILPEQLEYLTQKYREDSNPSRKQLRVITAEVGLSKRVVQVWFQNARARERKGPGMATSSRNCQASAAAGSVEESVKTESRTSEEERHFESIQESGKEGNNPPPVVDLSQLMNNPYNVPPPFLPFLSPMNMLYSGDFLKSPTTSSYESSFRKCMGTFGNSFPEGSQLPADGENSASSRQGMDADLPLDLSKSYKTEKALMDRSFMSSVSGFDGSQSESQSEILENNDEMGLSRDEMGLSRDDLRQSCFASSSSVHSQQGNQSYPGKRHRTHMSSIQIRVMKAIYADYKTPTIAECDLLGREIGLRKRVVQVWFQNARAKDKKNRLAEGVGYDLDATQTQSDCRLCRVKYTAQYTMRDHLFAPQHVDAVKKLVRAQSESDHQYRHNHHHHYEEEMSDGSHIQSGKAFQKRLPSEMTSSTEQGRTSRHELESAYQNASENRSPSVREKQHNRPRPDMPSMENYLSASASTSGAKSLLSNPPLPAPPVDLPPGFGTFPANGGFPNMFPFLYPGLNNFYPGFDLPFLPPQMMMSAGQESMYGCDPSVYGLPIQLLQIPPPAIQHIQDRLTQKETSRIVYSHDSKTVSELEPHVSQKDFALTEESFSDVGYICKQCHLVFPEHSACSAHQRDVCYCGQNLDDVDSVVKLVQMLYKCSSCQATYGTTAEFKQHCNTESHANASGS